MPGRRRGQRIADWPSLLDPGAADAEPPGEWKGAPFDGAGGAGMKIGAGGHPQPYDAHGRYTGPTGGVFDQSTGEIRTFGAAEDEGGEEFESEEETQAETAGNDGDEPGVLDVILASGGGLSGDGEARGPVTQLAEPAEKPPAAATWENDEKGKPDPRPEDLRPRMQKSLADIRANTPGLDSINVNSGRRPGDPMADPHADGRAVDINKINGFSVKDLAAAKGPEAEQAREAARNMVEQAKQDPGINQVIGPDGGWEIREGERREIFKSDPRVVGHNNHYHINVSRK
jgi:hypothetical protein